MTLNQMIARIEAKSLAHLQVRNFYFGKATDFLTDKTTLFASVFLQDNGGVISLSGKEYSVSFRMFFLDLVNVAANAKENELEVQSDMLSVAKGILAAMNSGEYTDWAISNSNNFQLVEEEFDDMVAGVVVDITIRTPSDDGYCEEPIL